MKKRRMKAAAKDFTSASLPHSRKDQFSFLLKNHLGTMFLLGLFLAIGLLPLVIATSFKESIDSRFYQNFSAGSMSEQDYTGMLFLDEVILSGVRAALSWVFALPLSGGLAILRDLLYSKHISLRADYVAGIKENYGNVGLLLFFVYLLYGAGKIAALYFQEPLLSAAIVSMGVLLLPIFFLAILLTPYYKGNAFSMIGSAARMYGKFLWKILLYSAVLFAIAFGLGFLPSILFEAILTIVLGATALPFALFFGMEMTIDFLDRFVNPTYYPEMVGVGLFQVEDDDDGQ